MQKILLPILALITALSACKTTSKREKSNKNSARNCSGLSSSECNNNSNCEWSSANSMCGNIGSFSNSLGGGNGSSCFNLNQMDCQAQSSRCMWDPNVFQCRDSNSSYINCADYNNNESQCNSNSSQCQWDPSSRMCYSINGSPVQCSSSYTQTDCLRYPTQCYWNGSSCVNMQGTNVSANCIGMSQTQCLQYPSTCTWDGQRCNYGGTGSFSGSACNNMSQQQCQASMGQCVWNYQTSRCITGQIVQCNAYRDPAQCNMAQGQCRWDQMYNRCTNTEPVPCEMITGILNCLKFPNECKFSVLAGFRCVRR